MIDAVNASQEVNTFIPALAYLFAHNPVEIEVRHEARHAGESKYSFYKLIRLNFDLMTGFTVVPLQLFSMLGMGISGISLVLFAYLIWDRIVHGPDVQGVFTLFAIVFFLLGLALFGIGLIGEYVGRTYEQVRGRPRYLIAAVLAPAAQPDPEHPAGARDHSCLAPSSSATAKSVHAVCKSCWNRASGCRWCSRTKTSRGSNAGLAVSPSLPMPTACAP